MNEEIEPPAPRMADPFTRRDANAVAFVIGIAIALFLALMLLALSRLL